jgi:membrane associated rhomboid family serine protease
MFGRVRWKEIWKCPVVLSVAILATLTTLVWWIGLDVSGLFENVDIRRGQFWRLITSIFLHVNVLHLGFNLYWLFVLGTVVERVWGHWKTAVLMLLLAWRWARMLGRSRNWVIVGL